MNIFTLPNTLSILRIPLALAFLQANPVVRATAIVLAMLSDCLDGYLARRYQNSSRFGTLLDPISDKFFVFFVLGILMSENRLSGVQALTILCRDFSVILFTCYLAIKGKLATYECRAIWCGKVTTALQFIVLVGLTFHVTFPPFVFVSFIVLGLLALAELYFEKGQLKPNLPQ